MSQTVSLSLIFKKRIYSPLKPACPSTVMLKWLVNLFLTAVFCSPVFSFAADPVVVGINLNFEAKGDFFVLPSDDGDFLVRVEDLKSMGFRAPSGKQTSESGEPYLSLRSIAGVAFNYNQKNLSLEISAAPNLLLKRTIDFSYQKQDTFYYPEESSAFLNYRISHSTLDPANKSLELTNQIGIRTGKLLFQTDSIYSQGSETNHFNRLLTSFTHDRRDELIRTVVGDSQLSSGDLGNTVILGGVSYSKIYRIDPYFMRYPSVNQTGFLPTPSEVDIYLDGTRIRSEKLPPGEFELKNFYATPGAGQVEFVIRDHFGREQRIIRPFYLSERLLKAGLQEFSYNLGFVREGFATTDDRYTKPAFSAFHRYGKSDGLTLGGSAEAISDFVNLSPEVIAMLGTAGVGNAAIAVSAGSAGRNGLAGSAGYGYNKKMFSARALIKGFSKDYTTIGNMNSVNKKKYELSLGGGVGAPQYGSASLELAQTASYDGQSQNSVTLNYSKRLAKRLDFFASFRTVHGDGADNRLFAGVSCSLDNDNVVSSLLDISKTSDKELLQIQKNAPTGEGLGYRASIERVSAADGTLYAVNPAAQYNSRHAIFTADVRGENGTSTSKSTYQIGVAGSLAYVGNTFALGRPINDSFAVVKVGDLKGVRVYQNSQEAGTTDASGKLFVENLNSFIDNQISINDKDIPMEYSLTTVFKHISPPFRSGSCLLFQVTRLQPITGSLHLDRGDKIVPMEFAEARVSLDNREITIPTGKGGEFYLDPGQKFSPQGVPVEPGCAALESSDDKMRTLFRFNAVVEFQGEKYPVSLALPQSDELFIDLGKVVIKDRPLPVKELKGAGQ